jgi:hypothetical protein
MKALTYRRFALPTALLATVTVGACSKKDQNTVDTTTAVSTPSAPTPLRVADVQTGKSIGADKRISDQTDEFGVRDTIYVAVTTDGTSKGAKLTAKWTFNGAQTVSESSETIAPTGNATTEFHITKKSAWPKGKYKVDVSLDGTPAGSKEFTIK